MAWTSPVQTAMKPQVPENTWAELAALEYQSPGLTRLPPGSAWRAARASQTAVVPIAEVQDILVAVGVSRKQVQSVMKSLRSKLVVRQSGPREHAIQ